MEILIPLKSRFYPLTLILAVGVAVHIPAGPALACGWPTIEVHPRANAALNIASFAGIIILAFAVYVPKRADSSRLIFKLVRACVPILAALVWLAVTASGKIGKQFMGADPPTHLPLLADPRTTLALGFGIIGLRLLLGRYERRAGLVLLALAAFVSIGYTVFLQTSLGEFLTPYQISDPFGRLGKT